MSKDVRLVLIDIQNDFCDPIGSLYVAGAEEDASRVATMIGRLGSRISKIHLTMDSHRPFDVAHPIFWTNSDGKHPDPYTPISVDDVKNGVWLTSIPGLQKYVLGYVEALASKGKYGLFIWPEHCCIGTWGHGIFPVVSEAVMDWERDLVTMSDIVTKGSNPFTEHYSAIEAEVPSDNDPTTQLNTAFIDTLQDADIVAIAGEALSHCVANTVNDIIKKFGDDHTKKIVLLTDACSNVTNFEGLGDTFVAEATAKGMQVSTTIEFLK
jgi:nicotinamidase-related amidase